MSVEELPKVINWKVGLKNGASIDINVRDGDASDGLLKAWVDKLVDGQMKYFYGSFEQGDIWVSPDEFSMALRAPFRTPAAKSTADFAMVEENGQEGV